jgi:hypothetical protein
MMLCVVERLLRVADMPILEAFMETRSFEIMELMAVEDKNREVAHKAAQILDLYFEVKS